MSGVSCSVAWDAALYARADTDASFDVVVVEVRVDPRHENALALEVRTVHGAGDFAATCDPVDPEPSGKKASKAAGQRSCDDAGDLDAKLELAT
jgi:hypothetical protein